MSLRSGRTLSLLAALIAFVVYLLTMARTVTWLHNGADSGDLVTAAFTFGVPHPPGYPLFTILSIPFSRIPFVEPAQGVGILVALAAAAAIFVLSRAGAALIEKPGFSLLTFIPPIAVLAFAFAPALWAQATLAEVYTLNLFFVALILWACVSDHPRRIEVAALAFGLGMAHHLAILLLAPGAWLILQPTLKDRRALVFLLAPLLLYLYLPLAAWFNPPTNWGDPATREGFTWLVTAELYRPYLFGVGWDDARARLAFAARSLMDQYSIFGVVLSVWGLVRMAQARGRLWLGLGVMLVPVVAYAVVYASRDAYIYLLPAFAIALLFLIDGAGEVLVALSAQRALGYYAVALLALLPIYNLASNYAAMDLSHDRTAFEYARQAFAGLPDDAVIFADGDNALFALLYYRHAIAYRGARSVIVSQGLLPYAWYYNSLRRIMSEVRFQPPEQVTDAHARAREIIRVTFAEGRMVCFTDSSPLLPEFEYADRGKVKCVLAEKTPIQDE